jgi:hypothetical protein
MSGLVTSGTYGYSESTYTLIRRALLRCNVIADEEQPTATQASDGLLVFNELVAGWAARGIRVWAQQECILFLQTGQTQYKLGPASPDHACLFNDLTQGTLPVGAALGATALTVSSIAGITMGDQFGVQLTNGLNFWSTVAAPPSGTTVTIANPLPASAAGGAITFDYTTPLMRPLRVLEGRRYNYLSTQQVPLIVLARFDYDYLPNPYNTGTVTQYFFDPQMGNHSYAPEQANALFNAWPTPQDNTNAVRFVGQRPLQNMTTMAQAPDFPAEWFAALSWNLAREFTAEYSVPEEVNTRIEKQADAWFATVAAWDREPEPYLFGMAMQPGYR